MIYVFNITPNESRDNYVLIDERYTKLTSERSVAGVVMDISKLISIPLYNKPIGNDDVFRFVYKTFSAKAVLLYCVKDYDALYDKLIEFHAEDMI